ncbi:hypothetical protein SEA_CLUBPENGUIN_20 [Streptomyces phage ClubPenguin]|nr:hypothetical protein SEA_CLUBPENGUIN_20 [Streptomyces phage ClubPenguin]
MTIGFDVNKNTLDMKAAQAVLAVRSAFEQVETITKWLANHPNDGTNPDPLTLEPFLYTADEAYAMRNYFETFDGVRTANAATFDAGRKMTGLE